MKPKRISQLETLLAVGVVSVALFSCSDLARADVIIDTGSTGPFSASTSPSLYFNQWVAAEFTLPESATISDIRGWISCGYVSQYGSDYGGQVTFSLCTSSNSLPASVLYSTSVNVPFNTNNIPDWYGPSGLNWSLPPGKYWLAFEVQAPSSFKGEMPVSLSSSLPLAAIYEPYLPDSVWSGGEVTSVGVQIYGTVGSVLPIPLNIQSITNGVVLSWNDPSSVFVLQAAPTVSGVFTNIPSASSPYTNAITNPQQYFQLIYPAN
jgi:hypothetical protein